MDENIQNQILQSRATAQEMGQTALEAINRGDIGMARMAARQAAQWAGIVMQLESGEKQFGREEETAQATSVSFD